MGREKHGRVTDFVNVFTFPQFFSDGARLETPGQNMIGENHGVVANAGEERGIHLRQPLQAKEIQA